MKLYCDNCKHVFAADYQENGGDIPCPKCQTAIPMPAGEVGPGVVVDGFLIKQEIGQGGMGKVYEAKQLSLDRSVALKVLLEKFAQNRDYVDGLMREARAAAKINHPNIVQAYSVGEDNGIVFFAMEMIRGETMKQRLQREKILPFDEAAKIVRDVASALDIAWREQKLVHQDIKPDNIMLSDSGFTKLADLGLAKTAADPEEEAGDEVLGTPQYISPEQLTGVPTDVRSDIYSLGATFYHFVTGRFAYVADSGDQMARMHVEGHLQPPREVNPALPEELNAIIMKMMARDIHKRYQDPKVLVKALDVYLRSLHSSDTASVPKFDVKKKNVKIPAIKAPAMKIPAVQPKAEAKPAPAPTVKPVLNVVAPPAAKPAPPPPPQVIPAEKITPVAPPPSPEPPTAEKQAKEPEEEAAVQLAPAPVPAEETPQGETPAAEEIRKKRFPLWLLIVLIVLVVLLAAGAGLWFFRDRIPFMKKFLPAQTEKTTETTGTEEKTEEKTPAPAKPAKPAAPPKPAEPAKPATRQEFMKQIGTLRSQARSGKLNGMELLKAGDAFMLEFKEPVTDEETFALTLFIDEFYAKADEALRMAPARQKAAAEYARALTARTRELQMEAARQKTLAEKQQQAAREAEENKRKTELEAAQKAAETARLNAIRLQEAQQGVKPFREAVALALQESVTAYNPQSLQQALQNAKRYKLPYGIPSQQETQLLRNFQAYCNQAMAEYNLYKAFRQRLTKINANRPFQLSGKELLTIAEVAPGKISTIATDGSINELKLTSAKMKNNFINRLHYRLNRDKGVKFTLKQVAFFYELMEGNFKAEPYNNFWKQILSVQP